ncbi:MAG: hypothetical protein QMD32_02185 [Smithellaceae bacterium]|nr:hypothetical protein [Smithellaceae bacterium]
MDHKTFKIRLIFLLPLAIIVTCLFFLTMLAIFSPSSRSERVILPIIFLLGSVFFGERATRRVALGEQGLSLVKFFRRKELLWTDITHVAGLSLRNKAYLLLTTVKGFFVISDNLGNFSELSSQIVYRVGRDKVEQEVIDLIDHPSRFLFPLLFTWTAAVLVILMALLRFIHL